MTLKYVYDRGSAVILSYSGVGRYATVRRRLPGSDLGEVLYDRVFDAGASRLGELQLGRWSWTRGYADFEAKESTGEDLVAVLHSKCRDLYYDRMLKLGDEVAASWLPRLQALLDGVCAGELGVSLKIEREGVLWPTSESKSQSSLRCRSCS